MYKRGRRWWIVYYIHGRQVRESVGFSYREAVRARARRIADIEAGRLGLRPYRKIPTLLEFVQKTWSDQVATNLKPSTRRGYETYLRHHLLPEFGDYPLSAINRAALKAWIAKKAKEQRYSYSRRNPNPHRPTLSKKSVLNMVALLAAILETATVDYELIPANPLRGILRRRNFADFRPQDRRVRILEPEDFRRAVAVLKPPVLQMVLFAALTGCRWGEQVALCIEDVDFRRNRLRITRSLYKRSPQTPKTEQSVRDIVMSPIIRRILQALPWQEGYVFSPDDGKTPIGDGSWLKRQWRKAQVWAGIQRSIRWHDLRHQFVSLLIAAGKDVSTLPSRRARRLRASRWIGTATYLKPSRPPMWSGRKTCCGRPVRTRCAQFVHKKRRTRAETRVLTGKFLVEAAGIEPAPPIPPISPEPLEDKGPSDGPS